MKVVRENKKLSLLKEENKKLKTAIDELSILNEIATAITSTQSIEKIIELIVSKCIKHLKVEQGVVTLFDEKDVCNPFHTMIRKQENSSNYLQYRLDTQLTGWMLSRKAPLLINDLREDKRFTIDKIDSMPIKSLLSVPMFVKGKMIGLLTVFNKYKNNGFTYDDKRLLGIIAAQSAHVIENARLYQKEQALFRLEEEMRLAHEIQVNLLPKNNPQINRYSIAGKSIPAKEVGGDYYDFIFHDHNCLCFCLADVTGKGIPAAILMANVQAALRGQSNLNKGCTDCVSFTNDLLYYNTAADKFATLFYGILDVKKNEIHCCNARHNNPILITSDTILRPSIGGMLTGILPSSSYEEEVIKFNKDDIIVIFSDGISEALNNKEEEYSEERLIEVIKNYRNEKSDTIIEIILSEIRKFADGMEQSDDMTLVVIKREE